MEIKDACYCEHCGKDEGDVSIERFEVDSFIAYLCPTCGYVLTKPSNRKRFKQMIQSKNERQSNNEMQQLHKKLNKLIAVGITAAVVLISVTAVAQTNIVEVANVLTEQKEYVKEYVSFAHFKEIE